ncbi:hypothetical protein M8C21_032648 [Ambrosia artemisiifolia]|uniref:Uncharacterized protein n=1 Tax=Ambrosia artemisiifolia TaxID=4212 RepID=A0AAD5CFB9_AMBAR|nr:hypothetical protein M8C21_032648 [Ambrosia artemisiifolia]
MDTIHLLHLFYFVTPRQFNVNDLLQYSIDRKLLLNPSIYTTQSPCLCVTGSPLCASALFNSALNRSAEIVKPFPFRLGFDYEAVMVKVGGGVVFDDDSINGYSSKSGNTNAALEKSQNELMI